MGNGIMETLVNDQEIAELRHEYFELYGKGCPYHWDTYDSIEQYRKYLKDKIKEAKEKMFQHLYRVFFFTLKEDDEVCNHAYVKTIDKTYNDHELKCRILIEESTCIFYCRKEKERSIYMEPPRRKLPKSIKL